MIHSGMKIKTLSVMITGVQLNPVNFYDATVRVVYKMSNIHKIIDFPEKLLNSSNACI